MPRCSACGSEHPLSFFSAKQRKFAKERRQCLTCEESSAGVLVQAGRGRPRLAAGEIASRFHAQWHFTVGLENDRRGTIERSYAAFRGNVWLRRLAFRLSSGNLEGYAAFARNVSNKQLADLLSVPRQNVWEGAVWPSGRLWLLQTRSTRSSTCSKPLQLQRRSAQPRLRRTRSRGRRAWWIARRSAAR